LHVRDEREEMRGSDGVVVRAKEEPGVSPDRHGPESSLAGVGLQTKPTVVQKPLEGLPMAERISESRRDRAPHAANTGIHPLGPCKEGFHPWTGKHLPTSVPLLWRKLPPFLFNVESLRNTHQRFSARVVPGGHTMGVGLDVAAEAFEHLADGRGRMLLLVLNEDVVLIGRHHEKNWPFAHA
jgi:hypothetical protein